VEAGCLVPVDSGRANKKEDLSRLKVVAKIRKYCRLPCLRWNLYGFLSTTSGWADTSCRTCCSRV